MRNRWKFKLLLTKIPNIKPSSPWHVRVNKSACEASCDFNSLKRNWRLSVNDLNLFLFVYHLTFEDLEYVAWVIWTTFMNMSWCFCIFFFNPQKHINPIKSMEKNKKQINKINKTDFFFSVGFESPTRNYLLWQNLTTNIENKIDHKTISKVRKRLLRHTHTTKCIVISPILFHIFMGGFHNKITMNHVGTYSPEGPASNKCCISLVNAQNVKV